MKLGEDLLGKVVFPILRCVVVVLLIHFDLFQLWAIVLLFMFSLVGFISGVDAAGGGWDYLMPGN